MSQQAVDRKPYVDQRAVDPKQYVDQSAGREIAIELSPELVLCGDLTLPARARGVIVVPNTSRLPRQLPYPRAATIAMNRRGLATLLIDCLTPGEKGRLRPFGESSILAERLSGITDWLVRRPETADLRVGYLGIGQAAAVALQAAAQLGDAVGAIVLIGIPDAAEIPSQPSVPILLIGNGSVEDHRAGATLRHHFGDTLRLEVIPGGHTLGPGDPGPHKRAFSCAADWFTHYLDGRRPHEVEPGDSPGRGARCAPAPRRPLRRRKPPRRRAVGGPTSAG